MKYTQFLSAAVVSAVFATSAIAEISVQLGGGWNGKKVPSGQQCHLFGGKGSTPPMKVSQLPDGTAWVYVEYNDQDYRPLSKNGGHGVIGYPVKGSTADLYPVPGIVKKLPGQARVISASRGTGEYKSNGYMPPCSGGNGHRYFAIVKAISASGKVLEQTRVNIGRY
ncbi:hypothetical protein [Phaeobacter sp. B1627]|uniref:hypothetical protein n=1 Tax=Phaeobacter sp. B1627 TaxID=2583809 RepID=UPI0011191952|nr:hypothetical protein [Phaeobacter sp. B1627]TNJ44789.1 hypothetical protein FGE21_07095 [Phaeobacter sp. B1627]